MFLHSHIKPILKQPDSLLTENHNFSFNYISYKVFTEKKQFTEQYHGSKVPAVLYKQSEQYTKLMSETDWILLFSITLLAFLTYLKIIFANVFRQLITSLFSLQLARQFINEKSGIVQKASFFLIILFILSISLYFYSVAQYFSFFLTSSSFGNFILILSFTVLFFLIKYLSYKLIAYLTETHEITNIFINHFSIFYRNLAIFLPPLSAISFFIHYSLLPYWLISIGLLIIFFSILRIYRAFSLSFQMNFSFYYIFLYLCTIEILPIIYSIKLLNMWV